VSSRKKAAGTVVLIHGACVEAPSLRYWLARYTARGYAVVAAGVPLQPSEDCLKARDPSSMAAVVDYYEHLLLSMPEPPILIGHCFGGVIVQLLLDRRLGAAGVAISPPPVSDRRHRIFGLTGGGRRARRPGVDYGSPDRAPLLLVSGGLDRRIPAEYVEMAALRYHGSGTTIGYLEYPDACHHALHAPGWEQLADDVIDWAELYAGPDHPGWLTASR
jgi:alpha-beta hydrolase superfamily lysophospholipase